jgi:Lon protease-like protein
VTRRLPLFPLGSVLFPGLLMPLHIFEDRYRELVSDLLALPEEAREFGIVAIREGRETGVDGITALYEVGCTARLRQVEAYDDGRFDIVTTGATRFRLHGLDNSRAYFQGDVELLDEPPGDEEATVVADGVRRLFGRYRAVLTGDGDESQELPSDPGVLSYLVAAAMILDLADKQALLAAPDVSSRLHAELDLLRRETRILRDLQMLPAVELTRSPISPN